MIYSHTHTQANNPGNFFKHKYSFQKFSEQLIFGWFMTTKLTHTHAQSIVHLKRGERCSCQRLYVLVTTVCDWFDWTWRRWSFCQMKTDIPTAHIMKFVITMITFSIWIAYDASGVDVFGFGFASHSKWSLFPLSMQRILSSSSSSSIDTR